MSRVFFTADNHFGDSGIIDVCRRPFSTVAAMDEAMIENWNAVVRPEDIVWHLGDFAYRATQERMLAIFARLAGAKHLIVGNHDYSRGLKLPWVSQQQMALASVDGQNLVMMHYGMRVWPGQRRGAVHLYGHSHGRLPGTSLSLDVGVDCWDFAPVSIDQIKQRLITLPALDPEGDLEPEVPQP